MDGGGFARESERNKTGEESEETNNARVRRRKKGQLASRAAWKCSVTSDDQSTEKRSRGRKDEQAVPRTERLVRGL